MEKGSYPEGIMRLGGWLGWLSCCSLVWGLGAERTYSGLSRACRQGCPVEQSAESKPNRREHNHKRTTCYWSYSERETSGGALQPDTARPVQQGGHCGSRAG